MFRTSISPLERYWNVATLMLSFFRPARTLCISTRHKFRLIYASRRDIHRRKMHTDSELPSYGEERKSLGQFNTEVVKIDRNSPQEILANQLAGPGALLRQGQVVAFPTETVYGLGANALDGSAARKVRTRIFFSGIFRGFWAGLFGVSWWVRLGSGLWSDSTLCLLFFRTADFLDKE